MKRLPVDIDDNDHEFLSNLPWGYKGSFIRALLLMSRNAVINKGLKIIPDIISGKCTIVYREDI